MFSIRNLVFLCYMYNTNSLRFLIQCLRFVEVTLVFQNPLHLPHIGLAFCHILSKQCLKGSILRLLFLMKRTIIFIKTHIPTTCLILCADCQSFIFFAIMCKVMSMNPLNIILRFWITINH